jgi:hypothetical protein
MYRSNSNTVGLFTLHNVIDVGPVTRDLMDAPKSDGAGSPDHFFRSLYRSVSDTNVKACIIHDTH